MPDASLLPPFEDQAFWRRRLRQLIPMRDAGEWMRLPDSDERWEHQRTASYGDRLTLTALSQRDDLRRALKRAGIGRDARVLDAGMGPGITARLLAELGAGSVVGIDTDEGMLRRARSLPRSDTAMRFLRADLRQRLPFPDRSFDAIVWGDAWVPAALDELHRVLRPGGRLVVKLSGFAPPLQLPDDPAFASRVHAAFFRGMRRRSLGDRTGPRVSSPGELLADDARWRGIRGWTEGTGRFGPLRGVDEASEVQSFALFWGPIALHHLSARDRQALLSLYDPQSPGYLGRRAVHLPRLFTITVALRV
jgi:SAM-dependent methyltransferase